MLLRENGEFVAALSAWLGAMAAPERLIPFDVRATFQRSLLSNIGALEHFVGRQLLDESWRARFPQPLTSLFDQMNMDVRSILEGAQSHIGNRLITEDP